MSSEFEKEVRSNQRELFQRLNEVEKSGVAQEQINNAFTKSHEHLAVRFEEKLGHVEESFSNKLLSTTELLITKLNLIHDQTKKTNGSVAKHQDDIDCIQQNEVRVVTLGKDLEFIQRTMIEHDKQLEKLKDIVEPLRVAQRFPQTVRYTFIGFLFVVLASVWGILVLVRDVKKELKNQTNPKPQIEMIDKLDKNKPL